MSFRQIICIFPRCMAVLINHFFVVLSEYYISFSAILHYWCDPRVIFVLPTFWTSYAMAFGQRIMFYKCSRQVLHRFGVWITSIICVWGGCWWSVCIDDCAIYVLYMGDVIYPHESWISRINDTPHNIGGRDSRRGGGMVEHRMMLLWLCVKLWWVWKKFMNAFFFLWSAQIQSIFVFQNPSFDIHAII